MIIPVGRAAQIKQPSGMKAQRKRSTSAANRTLAFKGGSSKKSSNLSTAALIVAALVFFSAPFVLKKKKTQNPIKPKMELIDTVAKGIKKHMK